MIRAYDQETIIAQCTPHGSGAIALLRLSGTDAISIASKLAKLPSTQTLTQQKTHTIHFGYVVDENKTHVDHVLFLLMRGPNSFTGQDTVEITCHNNRFICEKIIALAIAHGARMATNGEFARRSVLNSKLDLVQAEAINELIHANTQNSLKQSLAQLEGSFSQWINTIAKQLVKAIAFAEASFEFIDEDIGFEKQITAIVDDTLTTITKLKQQFDMQQQIRQGIRIAIIGSVNAGKSSLFNALLAKERAIVTDIAGTTRDVIEAGLYKNGNYWTLIDTAGLRQTDNMIEKEGIKRSLEEAARADIILLVFDGSRTMTPQEASVYDQLHTQHAHKTMVIRSKNDLPIVTEQLPCVQQQSLITTHTDAAAIQQVENGIQTKITALFESLDAPFLLNQRQFAILLQLEQKLIALRPLLVNPVPYELVSYHLNDAVAHTAELTGKSISEQGMDSVFREFCVGK